MRTLDLKFYFKILSKNFPQLPRKKDYSVVQKYSCMFEFPTIL